MLGAAANQPRPSLRVRVFVDAVEERRSVKESTDSRSRRLTTVGCSDFAVVEEMLGWFQLLEELKLNKQVYKKDKFREGELGWEDAHGPAKFTPV